MDLTDIYKNEGEEKVKVNSKTLRVNIGRFRLWLVLIILLLIESSRCPYDLGGYFIINGNEKVIVGQEKIAEQKVYVLKCKNNMKYSHILLKEIVQSMDLIHRKIV